jgi:Skp family chaperone for outer membrane proteins
MKSLKTMSVMAALGIALAAAPAFAQTPPPTTPPPAQPPATQPPVTQPPATPPAGQTPAPPTAAKPAAPVPFPEGAKVAFVDIQSVAQNSAEGKAATARIEEARKKITASLQEKTKAVQALQQKLQQGANVMSPAALSQLEKDIEKQNRELQFAQQDAQTEVGELQQSLQFEFQEKLNPVIEALRKDKGLHMIFSIRDGGIAAADVGLDLTGELTKRFDAAAKPAAPKK